MKMILETNRLLLREIEISDAPVFYELNADPEVLRYTGDLPFESKEHAERFLADYPDYRKNGYGRWAVIERSTMDITGWCGLKLHPEGFVDIGFRFFRKYWNKRFATESAGACLSFGFNELQLEEIIARAASANKASIRVLEKLRMNFWKVNFCEGIEDSLFYRINRKEYLDLIAESKRKF